MGDQSNIEWTDATWISITGCTNISEGCRNCYARDLSARRLIQTPKYEGVARMGKKGSEWTGNIRLLDHCLTEPLRWKRPRMIFVNSMSDTFHKDVPFEFIDRIFAVMAMCPQHTFQVLTKRADRMAEYLCDRRSMLGCKTDECIEHEIHDFSSKGVWGLRDKKWVPAIPGGLPLPNVWLGVSAEDQSSLVERAGHLARCPAAVRFLSCEPMLGPLDLSPVLEISLGRDLDATPRTNIHWVIAGGESGNHARPLHPEWVRSLRDQCRGADIPFFFKQWGEWHPGPGVLETHRNDVKRLAYVCKVAGCSGELTKDNLEAHHRQCGSLDTLCMYRVGKKLAGRELDGALLSELPARAATESTR